MLALHDHITDQIIVAYKAPYTKVSAHFFIFIYYIIILIIKPPADTTTALWPAVAVCMFWEATEEMQQCQGLNCLIH